MTTITTSRRYAYDIGEEVVVRLDGIDLLDMDTGQPRCPCGTPPWTVAVVHARSELRGAPAYVLSLRAAEARCLCLAPESAIEGVA